ncbi:hypothetical protein [Ferruginibacter sp.]
MPDIGKKTPEEIQMAVGQCMMKKSLEDFMALAQERNIEMTDMEGMQKLGAEIGADLLKSDCKAMKDLMSKMAQSGGMSKDEEVKPVDHITLTGVVKAVETKEFVYVTLLSGAKSIQLVWSDMVTGGNEYAKNLAKLVNKSVTFAFEEKEVYSIKAKAYITVKMIKSLD